MDVFVVSCFFIRFGASSTISGYAYMCVCMLFQFYRRGRNEIFFLFQTMYQSQVKMVKQWNFNNRNFFTFFLFYFADCFDFRCPFLNLCFVIKFFFPVSFKQFFELHKMRFLFNGFGVIKIHFFFLVVFKLFDSFFFF